MSEKTVGTVEVVPCTNCDHEFSANEAETADFYDTDDLVHEIRRSGPWQTQGFGSLIEALAVAEVAEWTGLKCPECGIYTPDDTDQMAYYVCPDCGEWYRFGDSDPHEALMCCVDHHRYGGSYFDPDDGCLAGVDDEQDKTVNYVAPCYCHDNCPYYVCLVCHDRFTTDRNWENHAIFHGIPMGHEDDQKLKMPPEPGCEVCASEYCCEYHHHHHSPHAGHILVTS